MSTATPIQVDPVVEARANSIRDSFEKLRSLVVQIPAIQVCPELSEELQTEIAAYNEDRAGQTKVFRNLVDPVLRLISQLGNPGAENPDIGELTDQTETVKMNRMIHLEQAAELAATGHSLATRVAEELEPVAVQRETEFNETLETVKRDLTKIGQGIHATVAGRAGTNGAAAEAQFGGLARLNVRSSKAFAAAHDAKERCKAVKQTAVNCQNSRTAIRKELSRLAASEISI